MAQPINNQVARRAPGNGTGIDPTGMKPTQFFSSLAVRKLLEDNFGGDKQRAAIAISTMISIVGSNRDFQNCNPMEIFANVLRYEVLMGLSYAMGDYAVISYGGKPQFQMQYQGVCAMALATNAYADSDCFEVREGEFKGYDTRKRQPVFEWIVEEDERQKRPIVGYYAWAELKDGRFKAKYMTRNEILRHADRYSKAFQGGGGLEAYRKMEASGNWPRGKSPWFGPADDLAHAKMCKKTVILQLFKDPMLPKSNGVMRQSIDADEYQERTGESVVYGDQFDALAQEAALAAAREPQSIEAPKGGENITPEQKPVKTASRASGGAQSRNADPNQSGQTAALNQYAPPAPSTAPAATPMMADFQNMDSTGLPFNLSDENDPLA